MLPKNNIKGRRKKHNQDSTLENLIDAATNIFLSKGYEGASIEEISAAAKVTKPTLYYYFPSKEDLLFFVHMKGIEKNLKPYMDKVKAISDPETRCRTMLREYTNMICSEPALRFFLHGTENINHKYSKAVKKAWKEHYSLLRDTIKEIQAKGKFNPEFTPSAAALLILGMITWITFWYDYRKPVSSRRVPRNAPHDGTGKLNVREIADIVEMIVFEGLSQHVSSVVKERK